MMKNMPLSAGHRLSVSSSPIPSLVVDAIDGMDSRDGWSLADRVKTLSALKLTDRQFSTAASAPWRQTWLQEAEQGRIRHPHLMELRGRKKEQARRNVFLDNVLRRCSSVRTHNRELLRYLASVRPFPSEIYLEKFYPLMAAELYRAEGLKKLVVCDWLNRDSQNMSEDPSECFVELLYNLPLKSLSVAPMFWDYYVETDLLASGDLKELSVHYRSIDLRSIVHNKGPSPLGHLPNLQCLTLLFETGDYEKDFFRGLEGYGSGVGSGNAANNGCNLKVKKIVFELESLSYFTPYRHEVNEAEMFRLPVFAKNCVDTLVFNGFSAKEYVSLLLRSPENAIDHVPHIVCNSLCGEIDWIS